MRKMKRALLVTLFTAITIWIGWKVLHPDLTYKGKSLTFWLECYTRNSPYTKDDVNEAVKSIGTKAIPTLLRRLSAASPYSPLKIKSIELAQKWSFLRKDYPSGDELVEQGHMGFLALGEAAVIALPQLTAIIEQSIPGNSPMMTGIVMVEICPTLEKAIPLLIRQTGNAQPRVRKFAVQTLGNFHAIPDLSVPCLTKALSDPDKEVRELAVLALMKFGVQAKSAFPGQAQRDTKATNSIPAP